MAKSKPRKKTPQQFAWDALAVAGVPERRRPDGLRWWRQARRFVSSDGELAGFLAWFGKYVKPPWSPGQRFNLASAAGVESFKWQLIRFRRSQWKPARWEGTPGGIAEAMDRALRG